ncbi:MAG: asparaginase domain-containing protein [Bdellovibrionales bacterium]|jgi:L-asparaginase/Glu-tRNA(Gln) amidotransferase subunit D
MIQSEDIEKLIVTYQPPQGEERDAILFMLAKEGFISNPSIIALIGIGGTISSSYSPTLETIIPSQSKPSIRVMNEIQKWGINDDIFSAFDPFAKDSRDLVINDIKQLLDIVACIDNQRVLVTVGTYLLPKVTEALYRLTPVLDKKIIAVTGSSLPLGFLGSDAPQNVLAAIATMNYIFGQETTGGGKVFAAYHGKVYQSLEHIRALELHPKESSEKLVVYPSISIPFV